MSSKGKNQNARSPVLPTPAHIAPILPHNNVTTPVPIRILLFQHHNFTGRQSFRTGPAWALSDEIYNIVLDGFQRSPFFQVNYTVVPDYHFQDVLLQEDEDIVWVIDERRRVYNVSYTIPAQVLHAANRTRHYQLSRARSDPKYRIPTLRVVFMDYRDKYYPVTCTQGTSQLIELLGKENVRSVRQMLVRGRHWVPTKQWVEPGRVVITPLDAACLQSPVLHLPYTVRSDCAEAVQRLVHKFLPPQAASDHPAHTFRPIDVAHFWPLIKPNALCSNLRHAVTKMVLSLANRTDLTTDQRPLNVLGDFVSEAGPQGRNEVEDAYLEALMTTKIVVVAQRDDWEDHYRLFEGMIGGALVMTDPMLLLPEGLVDGKHLLVYKSLDHLMELIIYYLNHDEERTRIATSGYDIATNNHRSYHWMEKLFFAKQFTA